MSDAAFWAEVIKTIAYPAVILIIALVIIFVFRRPLAGMTAVSFGFAGVKFDLKLSDAGTVLQQLFDEALLSVQDLDDDDRKLFAAIRRSDGAKTVDELHQQLYGQPFTRKPVCEGLRRLRRLRSRKLVRPDEGDAWESYKHPRITRFAELILQVKSNAI